MVKDGYVCLVFFFQAKREKRDQERSRGPGVGIRKKARGRHWSLAPPPPTTKNKKKIIPHTLPLTTLHATPEEEGYYLWGHRYSNKKTTT